MTDLEAFKAMLSKRLKLVENASPGANEFEEKNYGPAGMISVTFWIGTGICGGGDYAVDAWFRQDGSFYEFAACD